MNVEKIVQNLRIIKDRQVSAGFAKKVVVPDFNNSPDIPALKTLGREKPLLVYPPIIVSDRREHFELVKGYPSVHVGQSHRFPGSRNHLCGALLIFGRGNFIFGY
ncbi:MAG: hypothetical protein GXO98_04105 [Nitrospirae bacterium]|nr:hypothetical protein [Nitrospirota bacterium]